jgi:hypothetical protein
MLLAKGFHEDVHNITVLQTAFLRKENDQKTDTSRTKIYYCLFLRLQLFNLWAESFDFIFYTKKKSQITDKTIQVSLRY